MNLFILLIAYSSVGFIFLTPQKASSASGLPAPASILFLTAVPIIKLFSKQVLSQALPSQPAWVVCHTSLSFSQIREHQRLLELVDDVRIVSRRARLGRRHCFRVASKAARILKRVVVRFLIVQGIRILRAVVVRFLVVQGIRILRGVDVVFATKFPGVVVLYCLTVSATNAEPGDDFALGQRLVDIQRECEVRVVEPRVLRVGQLMSSRCSRANFAMKGSGKPERITLQLQLQCETKQVHIKQKNNNQTTTTQKTQYKENKQAQIRNINKDTYPFFDGSHVVHVDA